MLQGAHIRGTTVFVFYFNVVLIFGLLAGFDMDFASYAIELGKVGRVTPHSVDEDEEMN